MRSLECVRKRPPAHRCAGGVGKRSVDHLAMLTGGSFQEPSMIDGFFSLGQ